MGGLREKIIKVILLRKDKMNPDIKKIREKIYPTLKRYDVTRAAIFGSYVRGENREDSDIDILVNIEKDISLLDFVGLKLELEDVLGNKVDLVEYGCIKPILKEAILREQVQIL